MILCIFFENRIFWENLNKKQKIHQGEVYYLVRGTGTVRVEEEEGREREDCQKKGNENQTQTTHFPMVAV